MSPIQKNKVPKIKKWLKKFLTDESWKITKKDALGLSAAWVYLSTVWEAYAAHTNHSNVTPCWHINQAARSVYPSAGGINYRLTTHSSGIQTGTYNHTPQAWHLNAGNTVGSSHTNQGALNTQQACHSNVNSHSNHSNHSNHWSGWWC